MPSSTGSALALASSLRALDDEQLTRLVRVRDVRDQGIHDYFDLAERLLDRANVLSVLARLDRRTLMALAIICAETDPGLPVAHDTIVERSAQIDHPGAGFPSTIEKRLQQLVEHGLLARTEDGRYVTFDAVADIVAAGPSQGLPSLTQLAEATPETIGAHGRPDQERVDAAAAEQAFATTVAIVEVLDEIADEPVRELARGGLGAPDAKRLAAAAGMPVDRIATLHEICRRAGLMEERAGAWWPSALAAEWIALPVAERWVRLATSWASVLDADVRFFVTDTIPASWGEHLMAYLRWFYPAADDRVRALIESYVASAEMLGVLALHTPSTPGIALVSGDADALLAAIRGLLPPEVEKVYLQNDLTVIAAGPLETRVHERLRTLASLEARGLASTYRISDESLTRALERGESEESILEFLAGISLTGIPQPVRYLVSEAAGRYGLLRVGAVTDQPTAARVSYARTVDPVLLETLLVDRRLAPLGLRRDGTDRAVSRFERDMLFFALKDARYPVAVENSAGELQPTPRPAAARVLPTHVPATSTDHATAIVTRVRTAADAQGGDADAAWLERQLELAIKSKLRVTVSVRMPGGTVEELVLEPTGLSSGRLRARDRRADIERTLPLSMIVAVGEADGD